MEHVFFLHSFSALPGPAWPNGPTRMAQGQEATQGHQSTTGWAQTWHNFLGLFAWWDLAKLFTHALLVVSNSYNCCVNIQHKKIEPIHGVSIQVYSYDQ